MARTTTNETQTDESESKFSVKGEYKMLLLKRLMLYYPDHSAITAKICPIFYD